MNHRVPFVRLGAIPMFALFALPFAACGSSSDGGGAGAGCGDSLQVNGQAYRLMLACDVPNLLGTGAHSCTEFFSNVPQIQMTFETLCSVQGGKKTERCATAGSLGSCTGTATTGTQGAVEATYRYSDARGTGSAAQYQADCDGDGVYAPPGVAPASGAAASSQVKSTCPVTGPASSGSVAFSVATLVNGEYLECTNYVGTVTADQLASVLTVGATTSACPEKNALCACTKKKAGPFGTDATLVYYQTSMPSSKGACDGVEAGCDTYTESYRAP